MFFDHLSIRGENAPDSMTLNLKEFLSAPDQVLQAAGDRIWFGSEATFKQIPEIPGPLPSDAGIVQFHSDPILQELSEAVSPAVNAGLGISGLMSVSKSVVEAGLSAREYDLSRTEPALSVELSLSLAEGCQSRKTLSGEETSFRYFSPVPVSQPASDRKLLDTIRSLSDNELTNGNPAGTAAAEIRAGLLLIHDYLEPSHEFSQSIQGEGPDRNGDYWHGIMHRREPDFGNSKYWFRRVGDHPCFARVAEAGRRLSESFQDPGATEWIEKLTRSGWDSMAAVDFFQEAHLPRHKGTRFRQFASRLQMQEMLILLTWCCRRCR